MMALFKRGSVRRVAAGSLLVCCSGRIWLTCGGEDLLLAPGEEYLLPTRGVVEALEDAAVMLREPRRLFMAPVGLRRQ